MQIVNPDLHRKMGRMTILVGGIGSDDGIVLAADRRMTSLATCAGQMDEHTSIFKITNLDKQKVAYAPVGDYITRDVGEAITASVVSGSKAKSFFKSVGDSLKTIGDQVLKEKIDECKELGKTFPDIPRALLVALYGPRVQKPQLWCLDIGIRVGPACNNEKPIIAPRCQATHVSREVIRGAIGNRSLFFQHYFEWYKLRPVSDLIFLSAHIVHTAHRFDPAMIEGLDVAVFKDGECHIFSESEKEDFVRRSEALDATIQAALFPRFTPAVPTTPTHDP